MNANKSVSKDHIQPDFANYIIAGAFCPDNKILAWFSGSFALILEGSISGRKVHDSWGKVWINLWVIMTKKVAGKAQKVQSIGGVNPSLLRLCDCRTRSSRHQRGRSDFLFRILISSESIPLSAPDEQISFVFIRNSCLLSA
jgi:hypothetical protein